MLGIFENCLRCGRVLVGEKSRLDGYGKTCKKKAIEEALKQQTNIFDFIEEETENETND